MKNIFITLVYLLITFNTFAQCPTPIGSTTTNCNSCINSYTTNQTTISVINNNIYCVPFSANITVDNLLLVSGKLIICGNLTVLNILSLKNSTNIEIIIQSTGNLNIGTNSKSINFTLGNGEGITNFGIINSYSDITINDYGYINNSGIINIFGSLKLTSKRPTIINKNKFYINRNNNLGGLFENNTSPSTICIENNSLFETYNLKNTIGEAFYYSEKNGIAKVKIINQLNLFWGNFINTTNNKNVNVCYNTIINLGSVNVPILNINPIDECSYVLPLTILNLYYKDNYINWNVADIINVNYFEIEKSFDIINFYNIGNIPVFNTLKEYQYYDNTDSLVYYRLKIIDFDKKYEYSNIITNNYNTDNKSEIIDIKLYDIEGKFHNIEDDNNLPSGIYLLKIIRLDSIEYKKIIIEL